jgi:hypothetical protein
MLVSVHRQLVSSEMIAFAMGRCGGLVGVGGKIMELCDSIVGALGHDVLLVVRCGNWFSESMSNAIQPFASLPCNSVDCGHG